MSKKHDSYCPFLKDLCASEHLNETALRLIRLWFQDAWPEYSIEGELPFYEEPKNPPPTQNIQTAAESLSRMAKKAAPKDRDANCMLGQEMLCYVLSCIFLPVRGRSNLNECAHTIAETLKNIVAEALQARDAQTKATGHQRAQEQMNCIDPEDLSRAARDARADQGREVDGTQLFKNL